MLLNLLPLLVHGMLCMFFLYLGKGKLPRKFDAFYSDIWAASEVSLMNLICFVCLYKYRFIRASAAIDLTGEASFRYGKC